MNRIRAAVLMVLAFAVASPAIANQIQVGYAGSPGLGYGPYQTGEGGEFTFNDVNPDDWLNLSGYISGTTSDIGPDGITSFQTFCLEFDEFIYPYAATYNAQLNTNAVDGGVGPGGDPISVGTGWLYSQFAQGVLAGYDYTNSTSEGRVGSADALQQAIWWLEEEDGVTDTPDNNIYMAAVVQQFGSVEAARENGGSTYGVYAINLTDPATGKAQDGLYYGVPDGGTTLTLLGMALCSVSIVSRRFRRA